MAKILKYEGYMKWTDIEIYKVRIVTRTMFYENDKYYPQVFLDECLYQLQTPKKQKYNL